MPVPPEATTVHGAFMAQAQRTPGAPAILHCDAFGPPYVLFTYRELRDAVLRLAHALRAAGGNGSADAAAAASSDADAAPRLCAFLLGSSPARIVGYFACLAAGFVYTPLETSHPPAVLARPTPASPPRALTAA